MSATVTYENEGRYRVEYTAVKAGDYKVHVKTGGNHIYCGLGEENKCSPFDMKVVSGPTVASMCEAESFSYLDSLVEAMAGETGKIFLQAKDAYGNNRKTGGDNIVAMFYNVNKINMQYRGNALDHDNGSYTVTYSIPIAGFYRVSIKIGNESVRYCVAPTGDLWNVREYDGVHVYVPPTFCLDEIEAPLEVIHHDLHASSSTVVEASDIGLTAATVGVEAHFVIESRDKFGNVRVGSNTPHISSYSDGQSDAFLVTLSGPQGYKVTTSSAIQVIECLNSSIFGTFRLSLGGTTSLELPHNVSAATMQVALTTLYYPPVSVEVQQTLSETNHVWTVTFLSHLELWSSFAVEPPRDGNAVVSSIMTITRLCADGFYPVRYTLWKKGLYELAITSGNVQVSESTYSIEVRFVTPILQCNLLVVQSS